LQGHIVAEVCDLDNEPLVKMVGGTLVQTVVSHDIIGRLMIQCARQHGLASVWQQVMGFQGALRRARTMRVAFGVSGAFVVFLSSVFNRLHLEVC
jgi:hypothetical protein